MILIESKIMVKKKHFIEIVTKAMTALTALMKVNTVNRANVTRQCFVVPSLDDAYHSCGFAMEIEIAR